MLKYYAEAQETIAVLSSKPPQYTAPSGNKVMLDLSGAQHTVLYPPGVVPDIGTVPFEHRTDKTSVYVKNTDTFNAAQQLVAYGSTAVLNFASALHPGGGFLNGANAQEECLCRASTLYLSIGNRNAAVMYDTNRNTNDPRYTDFMLYTPEVTVFRDIDGNFLEHPFTCGVITAPAVNCNKAYMYDTDSINAVMSARCVKLLKIAINNGVENIVLGAWGCGVFGNHPSDVAAMFYRTLFTEKFAKYFKRITFAVYDKRPDAPLFTAFRNQFCSFL